MNIIRLTVTGMVLIAFTMNMIGAAQERKYHRMNLLMI